MQRKLQKVSVIVGLISLLGGSLTFVMTWINIGFTHNFIGAWLSSFALCLLIMAPLGGVISFLVNKIVNAILYSRSSFQKNIAFGLMMAVAMESIMSIVTTINLHGFLVFTQFVKLWGATFVTALPLGITISILMTFIIKPRLIEFWSRA